MMFKIAIHAVALAAAFMVSVAPAQAEFYVNVVPDDCISWLDGSKAEAAAAEDRLTRRELRLCEDYADYHEQTPDVYREGTPYMTESGFSEYLEFCRSEGVPCAKPNRPRR